MYAFGTYVLTIVESRLKLFKNISPNTITIIGLLSTILSFINIFDIVNRNVISMPLFFLTLTISIFCDILDGIVARQYNKTSKFGDKLDSSSDVAFFIMLIYYFTNILRLSMWWMFGLLSFITFIIVRNDVFKDGSLAKNNDKTIFDKIISIIICNNLIWIPFCYILYAYFY